MPFNDLREFINAARAIGDLKEIHGAHWDLEIGALTEIFASREDFPLLLFDQIPSFAPSYRVASNLINHPRRSALAAGMSPDLSKTELVLEMEKTSQGGPSHSSRVRLQRAPVQKRAHRCVHRYDRVSRAALA